MDLYFKSAAIFVAGIIFALTTYIVSNEITLAQFVADIISEDTDNYALDVATADENFTVDKSAFTTFVIGQQHLHTVLLMDAKNYYIGKGNKVYVEFDVKTQLSNGDVITEDIKISTLNESNSAKSLWNAVNVSGSTGTQLDTITSFENYITTSTVKVERYTQKDGKIILVCKPNN